MGTRACMDARAQVMDVIEAMFSEIFRGIEADCAAELAAVGRQHPFEPFVMKPMRFTYAEGVKVRASPSPAAV